MVILRLHALKSRVFMLGLTFRLTPPFVVHIIRHRTSKYFFHLLDALHYVWLTYDLAFLFMLPCCYYVVAFLLYLSFHLSCVFHTLWSFHPRDYFELVFLLMEMWVFPHLSIWLDLFFFYDTFFRIFEVFFEQCFYRCPICWHLKIS